MKNFVVSKNRNNIIEIIIYALETKDKVDELISEFHINNLYEITILNIKIVPAKLIIKLNEIKDNILYIYVNEKKLSYYLRGFGFKTTYKKQIKSKNSLKLSTVKYIAIGGSAYSLERFIDIIKNLKPSKLSFFIIMHQKRDSSISLAQLLQKYTTLYTIQEAKSNSKIEETNIYVAPPNKQLIIINDYIFLTNDERNFAKPSISITFESLSHEYKDKLLAILLCGYGHDGSDSLKTLKKNNSNIIIQQPHECNATMMLEEAINSHNYDFILSIYDIYKIINQITQKKESIKNYITNFLYNIYETYGYDYRHYNEKHILRRIEYFYKKYQFQSFIDFTNEILNNPSFFQELKLYLSVNVTTFFRNPQTFKNLQQIILKDIKKTSTLKVWCAGCSSGEEAYSIAIMLEEIGILKDTIIYATDLNGVILKQAKNGLYTKDDFKIFEQNYKLMTKKENFQNYFVQYENFVQIKDKIKDKILFFKHNLATDEILNQFQLIFCRNVVIYFDKELKERVFNLFDKSLEMNGLLVLGESETLHHKNLIPLNKKSRIYKKEFSNE